MPKARIFNVMQYEKHPTTGEELLNEETIKSALTHKSIKRWAYCMHDKDVYSAQDEEDNPEHEEGKEKPRHWHIVMQCGSAVEIGTIAKWLGIAENFIDIPKGRGAGKFLDCVKYLTHEDPKQQIMGKHLYPDKEIKANFDFRAELKRRDEDREKYGEDLNPEDKMCYDVMYLGKTLRQCEIDDRVLYMKNFERLAKLRLEYIKSMNPPDIRINYYLYGRAGIGKDLTARALARALFPNLEADDDIFFSIGADNATFEGYDGQPVIIWSDCRSLQLLKILKGRENFFTVFDTHPIKKRQNVKFGSVNLCNVVNIINGQEDYQKFLDSIVQEKDPVTGRWVTMEDKGQSYRRFPFIIPLHDEDFDLLINKGFYENTNLFTEYYRYNGIRGSIQNIVIACGGEKTKEARRLSDNTIKPVVDKYNEVVEKNHHEPDAERIKKIDEELASREIPKPEIVRSDGSHEMANTDKADPFVADLSFTESLVKQTIEQAKKLEGTGDSANAKADMSCELFDMQQKLKEMQERLKIYEKDLK